MGEKDTLIKEKLKYSGLGNLKDIYSFAHDWMRDENINVTEDLYTEKVRGDSKEIEIKWTGTRDLDDYFKMHVELKWRILDMTDVEVQINGKKKKMNQFRELSIEIKGLLEEDHQGKWGKSGFQKMLKETYTKHLIKERKGKREDLVKDTCKDLKEEIKAFLELTGKRTNIQKL